MSSHGNAKAYYTQLKWLIKTRWLAASYVLLLCCITDRFEDKLVAIESKHSVFKRWKQSDALYKEHYYAISFSKKEQLLSEIWKAGQRRLFLLNLKRKYAGSYLYIAVANYRICVTCCYINFVDGQKIAKKTSTQITKETNSIKALLKEYNTCNPEESEGSLSVAEAMNIETIKGLLQKFGMSSTLAHGQKREVIDAYLALCRSTEELEMLHEEARNLTTHYEEQNKAVVAKREEFSKSVDPLSRGAGALLYRLWKRNSNLLQQGVRVLALFERGDNYTYCQDDSYSDEDSDDHEESDTEL